MTASLQIRNALVRQGYRFLHLYSSHGQRFLLYGKGAQVVLLHVSTGGPDGAEDGCELYQPVTTSDSIADTIAAIPA